MRSNNTLLRIIAVLSAALILIFPSGCGTDSTQVQTTQTPISSSKINSSFGYTIDIPDGWQIGRNDSSLFDLTIDLNKNNDRYFVNPSLSIFKADLQKQFGEDFINNAFTGTTSHKKINDLENLTKYTVSAYECTQNSAHKEYTCYYAFITTEKDFVVVQLTGDTGVKDILKSVLYNTIKTLKKS